MLNNNFISYLYMSICVTLDSSQYSDQPSNNFTVNFLTGIALGNKQWEVGLINGNFWYSVYNISSNYNNNIFKYSIDSGVTWKTITIPNGIYGIADLNDYIHQYMVSQGDYNNSNPASPVYYISLVPNFNTLRLIIDITNVTYQVDLTDGDLYELLGFNSAIITTTTEGPNLVDITRGVNIWHIRCNIVDGSYDNSVGSNILYSFLPTTPPGSNIYIEPKQRVYLPLYTKNQIQNINIYMTDQLGRTLDFNNEDITVRLHLRLAKYGN